MDAFYDCGFIQMKSWWGEVCMVLAMDHVSLAITFCPLYSVT